MTVWKYLQDEEIQIFHIGRGWWHGILGGIYERICKRIIRDNREYFNKLFEDFESISSEFVSTSMYKDKKINFGSYKINSVDYVYLLHGKNEDDYEKRAVVFEIKSGTSPIYKNLIDFWKDMIKDPSKYIEKCTEIRLFVIWVNGFDFNAHNLFYSMKEVKIDEIPPPDQPSLLKETKENA